MAVIWTEPADAPTKATEHPPDERAQEALAGVTEPPEDEDWNHEKVPVGEAPDTVAVQVVAASTSMEVGEQVTKVVEAAWEIERVKELWLAALAESPW